MHKKILTLVLCGILVGTAFAQEVDSTGTIHLREGEGVKVRLFSKRFYHLKDCFKQPTVSLQTGLGFPTLGSLLTLPDFNSLNFVGIRIGNTRITSAELKTGGAVNEFSQDLLFLENYSSKWKIKDNKNINARMWRFGLFNTEGYGYKLGERNFLVLTYSNSLNWSKMEVDNLTSFTDSTDINRLSRFTEQFRFGTSFASGVSFILARSVSLDVNYERSIVFPGHKFWYWLGSEAIELVSHALLDEFIEKVLHSSPSVTPIVNAILKGGLSFGIYELRKTNMNWPFKTEAPLFNDGVRIGLTFMF
jgi:hypothetical protein